MSGRLNIETDWQSLDEGSPEERACFAAIGIEWNNIWLTEGHDSLAKAIRKAPYLSGYHFAEWIAWNWWRLRWEPRSTSPEWAFAHRLSTIGGGYVWPNITIFSDGERTALIPRPTAEQPNTPYRYICGIPAILASTEFEVAIDQFIDSVCIRLREAKVKNTNLDVLWSEVITERRNPLLTQRRKFEALLGTEPDEANEETLRQLQEDSKELGESAVNEIAADHGGGEIFTAKALNEIAQRNGFDISPRDGFHFWPKTNLPRARDVPAWKLGGEAARAVRAQANLGEHPISDAKLAELAGVTKTALEKGPVGSGVAFAIDQNANKGRVVFRSKWKTGRRFDLARIIGDRLVSSGNVRLFPATRTHTYRQKMQRSFAAELLSPFEAIDAELDGDYSEEAQQEIGERFEVSPLTVRTLLVNHRRIDREELEEDFDAAS